MSMERTLVLVKPDAVKRGMIGKIISRFEDKGLLVLDLKAFVFTDALLKEHYSHLADKPFFPKLAEFMKSDITVAMCIAGVDAVKVVRDMVGVTNGRQAVPGSIRGDYSMSTQRNLVHASDAPDAALVELDRFFPPNEGGLRGSASVQGEAFAAERACACYSGDELV